jgi:two-component system cell cycle sensor histidine kinase/response regulator CckA
MRKPKSLHPKPIAPDRRTIRRDATTPTVAAAPQSPKGSGDALRDSEKHFRGLVENALIGFYRTTPDGQILMANPALIRMLGCGSFAEVAATNVEEQHARADYDRAAFKARIEQEGTITGLEGRWRRRDGTFIDVRENARVVRDDDGRPLYYDGTVEDITEQRRAHQLVHQQAAFMTAAMDGMAILGEDGRYLYVNEAHARTYGFEAAAELLGTSWETLYGERELNRFKTEVMPAVWAAGQWRGEAVGRRRDGTEFPQELSLTNIEGGGLVCVVRDISERKRTEEIRTRLATAVEQAAEVIVITDTEGTIQYVNPAFERVTGYSAAEAVGGNSRLLKSGVHGVQFYEAMWRTVTRGGVWSGHFVNRRKDGTLYEEEATISPIRDAAGAIVNFVAVKRDVTKEVQLAQQLRESQKLQAVGQLAGGVAHDFNNLLQAVVGTVEVLRRRGDEPEVLAKAVAELELDVRRGAALARQLLLFAHRGVVKTERVDLNDVVRGTEQLLRRLLREDIRIAIELAPEPLPVDADKGQFEQVLVNLAVNAVDAMPAGGCLTIRTSRAAGDDAVLEVQDTGFGIPEELQPRIFEPFFTTKGAEKGIGLGLSVVHGIVTGHGGTIAVASRPGQGTTFRIALPYRDSGVGPRAVRTVAAPAPSYGGSKRVLLVEDEPGARDGLQQALIALGCATVAVASGEEAVALPAVPAFDVLLTDLMLPGLHGGEVAAALRARWPRIEVIVMSGYAEDEAIRRGVFEGKVRFLQKPFDMAALAREMGAVLGGDETGQS